MMQLYIPGKDSSGLVKKIENDFPDLGIKVDEELVFYKHLIPLVESREEICTIRFRPNTVRIPGGEYGVLPWVETDPNDKSYRKQIGTIKIPLVVVADIQNFPLGFTLLDEYHSKEEMIADIQDIYNCILKPTDILSGYILGELRREK